MANRKVNDTTGGKKSGRAFEINNKTSVELPVYELQLYKEPGSREILCLYITKRKKKSFDCYDHRPVSFADFLETKENQISETNVTNYT